MDRRHWLQRLALLPLWLVFLWWWGRILREWPRREVFAAALWVAECACLYGIAVLLWIWHNVSLARRRGRRRTPRLLVGDFSRDILGRPVEASPAALLAAPHLVVEIREGRKCYRPVAEPGGDAGSAPEDDLAYAALD